MKNKFRNNIVSFHSIIIGLVIALTLDSLEVFGKTKPNILWLNIEGTSPQFVGCYGDNCTRTSVIDKRVEEGVHFTNAFSTGTVCSPSSSAIITGVHTFKMGTGNHRNNYRIPDFIKGFPYYLQQQGYYVSNNSKTDYNVAKLKQFTAEAWNESSKQTDWWNCNPGQPFFVVFNYVESHHSHIMTETYVWYLKNVLEQLAACMYFLVPSK